MKKRLFCSAIILFIMTACGQKEINSSDLVHLNLQQAEKLETPKLSTLLKDIRYVALETDDNCVLKKVSYIVLTDKYIVCEDGVQCYVFDKANGSFIRTVGLRKDRGPEGYASPTTPLCVIGNEVLMLDWEKEKYNVYSLDNGKLIRKIPGEEAMAGSWTFEKVFPLNDTILLQYPLNIEGKNKYGLKVRTLSGNYLKKYPSTNNCESIDLARFYMDMNEVTFYTYNGNTYFHECTSDTIFRLNGAYELEPCYVVGLGEMLPTLAEVRTSGDMEKGKFVLLGDIVETNHWLLFPKNFWNDNAYFYHKAEQKMGYMNGKETKGFTNDLNGFLPFWPKDSGRGKAKNEVWAILQPEEYLEGVEQTGKNPLGIDLQFDDNPVIVIGTLK